MRYFASARQCRPDQVTSAELWRLVCYSSSRPRHQNSGGSRGPGGHGPPLAAWKFFFASTLILLLSRLHTMGRGNTKVAVCRRFLLSNRLVFAAFCCLCAVHCMQAAATSFVSPKAVFLACTIGSWTAKNSAQNALEFDIFRSKVKKIFWGGGIAPSADPSPSG